MNAFDIPELDLTAPDLPEAERKYPKCIYCEEYIKDEHCYFINDDYVCEHCIEEYLNDNCKMKTEDYPQW